MGCRHASGAHPTTLILLRMPSRKLGVDHGVAMGHESRCFFRVALRAIGMQRPCQPSSQRLELFRRTACDRKIVGKARDNILRVVACPGLHVRRRVAFIRDRSEIDRGDKLSLPDGFGNFGVSRVWYFRPQTCRWPRWRRECGAQCGFDFGKNIRKPGHTDTRARHHARNRMTGKLRTDYCAAMNLCRRFNWRRGASCGQWIRRASTPADTPESAANRSGHSPVAPAASCVAC